MLNCREVTELCSRELEQPLGLRERLALRLHLAMCKGCANFRGQMGVLRQAMQRYAHGEAIGAQAPTEPREPLED